METVYDWPRFFHALAAAINGQIDGPPVLLAQPHGEFLWFYRNGSGIFNQGTWDFLSARIEPAGPSVAAFSTSGGFPNAYVQILAKIVYGFSAADRASVAAATAAASVQAGTVVGDYQGIFGAITEPQLAAARAVCGLDVQTPLDYVISYAAGALWSGRQSAGQPPLTYAEMTAAAGPAGLRGMLPAMPAPAGPVVESIWRYVEAVAAVADLQSQAQRGSWLVARLLANTTAPTAANGGMQTVDPGTGVLLPAYQLRYDIGTSIGTIAAALADTAHALEVTATLTPVAPQLLAARVGDRAGMPLPASGLALFSTPEETIDLTRQAASPVDVTIRYPGYLRVPVSAAPWSDAGGIDWFLARPIAEAHANGAADVTGYRFIADPGYALQSFADGGTFGMVTSLLVSAAPVVTLSWTNPDARDFIPPPGPGRLELFSLLRLPDYRVTAGRDAGSGSLRLVFAPDPLPVPILMQSAFPIGCTIANPGELS